MQVVGDEVVLDRTESVINRLHDQLVSRGMDAAEAASRIRSSLRVRARAVHLSGEFWAWLGS